MNYFSEILLNKSFTRIDLIFLYYTIRVFFLLTYIFMAQICLEFSIRSDYYNCDMLLFFLIFVYIKAILLLGAHNYYILIFLVNSSLEAMFVRKKTKNMHNKFCLLYTSPSPRDATLSRMPSSA